MILFDWLITEKQIILDKIFSANNSALLLTYFNQNCFNIYYKNEIYRKLIDEDFSVYPDGIGIFLSLKFLFKKKISRTDATNVNHLIIDKLIESKEPVFIIGGKFDKAFLVKSLNEKGINLGEYCQGFFSETEKKDLIEKVNANKARFILIGMGVPGQEYLANEISKASSDKIIICVGNFFEFYLGTMKRAPVIFQKLGIEWLFRLLTEPGRLWKRYILGIPEFLYRIISLKMRLR